MMLNKCCIVYFIIHIISYKRYIHHSSKAKQQNLYISLVTLWTPHTGGPVAFSTAIITYRLLFDWCRKLFDLAVVDCITPDHVGSGCAIVYCMKTEA